jgi:hypothetical protein
MDGPTAGWTSRDICRRYRLSLVTALLLGSPNGPRRRDGYVRVKTVLPAMVGQTDAASSHEAAGLGRRVREADRATGRYRRSWRGYVAVVCGPMHRGGLVRSCGGLAGENVV